MTIRVEKNLKNALLKKAKICDVKILKKIPLRLKNVADGGDISRVGGQQRGGGGGGQ